MTSYRRAVLVPGLVMILAGVTTACSGAAGPQAVTVTQTTEIAPPAQPAVSVPSLPEPTPTSVVLTPTAPPSTTTTPTTVAPTTTKPTSSRATPRSIVQQTADPNVPGQDHGPACAADKRYSDESPAGLRADVITAWNNLKVTARKAGIPLCLNDGKRSRAQQVKIYEDYVKQYGKAMADQLVLRPEKSAHVAGYAVDVQPAQGYNWLEATAGKYGFCRTYDNEAWHFEYNKAYAVQGCPPRQPAPEH